MYDLCTCVRPRTLLQYIEAASIPLVYKLNALACALCYATGWVGAVALRVHGQQSHCCTAAHGKRR